MIALVAGLGGYLFRRNEHRREQRLTAYRSLLAAFFEAANTGATLLSVHNQTGFPTELKAKGRTPEDIDRFTRVHSDAWDTASKARYVRRCQSPVCRVACADSDGNPSVGIRSGAGGLFVWGLGA